MPLVAYGHYGPPVLMLPTAAADFLEYERFGLIDSLSWFLNEGKVKLYSVDSVNRLGLMNEQASPEEKIAWMQRYDAYLTEEVLPLIRADSGGCAPMIMGISLGSSLAANTFFKHPDLFSGAMLISGSYDLRGFFNGFYNEDLYFNNPVDFVGGMHEGHQLNVLRHGGKNLPARGSGKPRIARGSLPTSFRQKASHTNSTSGDTTWRTTGPGGANWCRSTSDNASDRDQSSRS